MKHEKTDMEKVEILASSMSVQIQKKSCMKLTFLVENHIQRPTVDLSVLQWFYDIDIQIRVGGL